MRERLDALLRAIRARPGDDALRLVYADALEEAGERHRAEFVRCELAGETDRADELRLAHREELAGTLIAKHALDWSFERGLVSKIDVELTPFVEHGAALLRAAPIAVVTLHDDDSEATVEVGSALAEIEELAQIRLLGAIPASFPSEFLASWLGSPHFTSLETLRFVYGDEAKLADLVARSPLPALRELCFWMESGTRGDAVARSIAASPLRQGLGRLEISGCEPTDDAVRAIVESPHLHALEQLLFGSSHYAHTDLTAAAIHELSHAKNLTRLVKLDLSGTELTDEALVPFAEADGFRLQSLHLPKNRLVSIDPILRGPAFSSVRTLDLRGNALDDRAARALANWPGASKLRYLDVSRNEITPAARDVLRKTSLLADCEVIVD